MDNHHVRNMRSVRVWLCWKAGFFSSSCNALDKAHVDKDKVKITACVYSNC